MTEASRRRILSIAIDMKVPAHGPVQILEIMPAHHAGYKGYTQLHGKDMVQEHILPYLKDAFPGEAVAGFESSDYHIPLHAVGAAYGFEMAEKGSGIIYPDRRGGRRVAFTYLSRTDLHFARRYPEFTLVNGDQQMLLVQENKAAQSYLVKEDEALGRFYVPGFVTTSRYDTAKADRILDYLNHDGDYVIKPVDQAQGNGVRIVPAERLDLTLRQLLRDNRKQYNPLRGVDYWMTDINPVFMVEPYIASREIWHMGDPYDGTLRVFATMHNEGSASDWRVKVHDGYWKLPSHPLRGPADERQRVSHSPDRQEKDSRTLQILSAPLRLIFGMNSRWGSAALWRGKMDSAAMTDGLRQEIFPQIESFCRKLPEVLERKSLYQRTAEHLESLSRPRQGTGAMMLAHPIYYPGSEDDPLPLNAKAFPAAMKERLRVLSLKDSFDNATAAYLRAMMRKGDMHMRSLPLDVFLRNPDFVRAMDARYYKPTALEAAVMLLMSARELKP